MALNFPKLPAATDAKTRIFYIIAGVVGVSVLGFAAYKFFGGGSTGGATSRVAAAPSGLQSTPGSQLTPEYYQALRQANTQAAQQAQISGGSAVPTLMNVPGAGFGQSGGCTVMCPSDNNPDVTNDINDLVKSGKLSQEDANKLLALGKQNVSADEYAAQLDELVRQGKLTPEQARKLLADYKKQHANALLTESGRYLDGMIKSGQLPLTTANELLDLQKRNLTPAEYQAELQRLVREGKLTPDQAAKLLAQYTQQRAAEVAKTNQFQLTQMARSGQITPAVAQSLADLQNKNVSVSDYAAELDRLVKAGKLTPEAAAKLLAQYKQQKLGAALAGCLGKLMQQGGDKATEAQRLLDMQSTNVAMAAYLDELKRAVSVNLVTPEMAACLLQEYQAATAPVQAAAAPATLVNIPGASDFAKLQQRLQDQQGNQAQGPAPTTMGADQFAAIQSQAQQQAAATASADRAQIISDTEAAMSAQAQQLIGTAWVVPTMEHKGGQSDQDQKIQPNGSGTSAQSGQSSSSTTTTTTNTGAPIIKAGTIFFAVLDTGADSDYPDTPIMATIVQGPFKGAKLLGKIALAQSQGASAPDRISLTFNLMNMDAWPTSKAVTAFAIDPDTARTVLASNVDYHYMKRYGAIMATAFLSGYANAVMTSGSSTTAGVLGTTTSNPQLSPGSKLAVGLGQIGTSLSSIVQNYSTIPPTVKVNAGVGLGILYMADVTQ